MGKNIHIGFIGLNPNGHRAATAHFPALKVLTDKITVVGVANSTPESSRCTVTTKSLAFP